ncbi:MAG: nucleotidyltransferase domain-containing protein [Culturomica sp.]|jgi:predicted nucleotidyltransferase|nr:nucleotidyltransferase domain-containing protein [Culturomica sp.]
MNRIVTDRIPALVELCKKYRVMRMYLFGSAARGDFDEDKSDIDLLISFSSDVTLEEYADNYFDLMFELDELFGCEVDLVTEKSLKNPYLISSIDEDKQLIYEAAA